MSNRIPPPTRAEGLARLASFVPKAGRDYAAGRNFDLPGHPHVSGLSPFIRHRLVSEEEVLRAVLGRFSLSSAEKFVQEVFWRSYWKGWLELRPAIWTDYRRGVQAALNRVQTEAGLRSDWEAACRGETGIDAFDHWARELEETGYLHNHARMWFASIWIFTLRLPWELGADFFLRHLLDGDPASNTLSWRWVAGLQTTGKTYLARASNIARYTEGRFSPEDLASVAEALDGRPHPPPGPAPHSDAIDAASVNGLMLTEDDLAPGFVLSRTGPRATLVLLGHAGRSPLKVSRMVADFTRGAAEDAVKRYADRLGEVTITESLAEARAWAAEQGGIVAPYVPQGPARDALSSVDRPVAQLVRPYDALCWPHASAGFFKFREKIPGILAELEGPGKA